MKKIKLILIASILLCLSCERNDEGQWVNYYRNKTATGYVFYCYHDSANLIIPICPAFNIPVTISASTLGSVPNRHDHVTYTDINGWYQFKLVTKIGDRFVKQYNITSQESYAILSNIEYSYRAKSYSIDTLFIPIKGGGW